MSPDYSGITPEMAKQELARRQQQAAPAPDYSGITPEMARAELARRQNVPRETEEKPQTLLEEAKKEFGDVGRNATSFVKGAGQGILNSAINASNFLNRKDTKGFDFAPQDAYGKGGEIAGDIASFAVPYTAGAKGISSAANYMPKIANAFNQMKGMLPEVAQKVAPALGRATGGGAVSGLISPEGKRTENALLGAGLGLGGEAAIGGYQAGKGAINKILQGKRSPAEAKVMAEQVGDLPVPYGDIVQSPALQAINRGIEKIPFSGVGGAKEKVLNAAEKQSEKLLSSMRGTQEESAISKNIADKIKENRISHRKDSEKLYTETSDLAEKNGVKLNDLTEVRSIAEKYLNEVKAGGSPLSEKIASHLESLASPKLESDIVKGTTQKPLSFKEAHQLKKDLGKLSRSYEKSDPYAAKMYGDLSQAVKKDMVVGAELSGDKEVVSKLSQADKHFIENRLPYESRDVKNLVKNKKNLENLPNTLLQDTDHAKKILSDLPLDVRKSVAYKKFKSSIKENAEGVYESEPQKLFNAFNNLSPLQKNNLFTKAEQEEFRKLGTLAKLSKGKTGSGSGLGAGAIGLDVLAAISHSPKAAAALLGLEGVTAAGARGINKLLTSPRIRNSLLQRSGEPTRLNPKIANTLRQGAMGAAVGANNSLSEQ